MTCVSVGEGLCDYDECEVVICACDKGVMYVRACDNEEKIFLKHLKAV